MLATKNVFDVVPTINPGDIRWSRHASEEEAEAAKKHCPHEAYVRRLWIAEDEGDLNALVETMHRETAVEVHIARGVRH